MSGGEPKRNTEVDRQFEGPIQIADPQAIAEICRLRVRVWSQTGSLAEDAFPDGQWRDAIDDICKHWCIRRCGEIVAAARWSLHASLQELPECEQYMRYNLTRLLNISDSNGMISDIQL